MKRTDILKCKKSIYKSTYKKNAFTKDKHYTIREETKTHYWITDNLNNSFSFTKTKANTGEYLFSDYFL